MFSLNFRELFDLITKNQPLLIGISIVFAGAWSVIKWLDSRNRELQEKRYSKYMELMGIISGIRPDGNSARLTEQIAAVWFLLEYKEYKNITRKIFTSNSLNNHKDDWWGKQIAPEVRLLMVELQNQNSDSKDP